MPCAQDWATFSPDGSRLVVTTNDGPAVHVWDLRAIRKHLAGMGLDWDAPPYPEVDPALNAPLPPLVVLPPGGRPDVDSRATAVTVEMKLTAGVCERRASGSARHIS